jgi:hypothetical protein
MKTLKSGAFTVSRIDISAGRKLYALFSAAFLFAGFAFYGYGLAGLAMSFIVLSCAQADKRRRKQWHKGQKGKAGVTEALRSLPGDYVLLNDLELPDIKGSVDHVVIGPNGLFVLATKNYSGFIKCERDSWWFGAHGVKSLSKQAKRNSIAVRTSIGSVCARQGASIPYVVPLLVFVDARAKLKLSEPTVGVLRLPEIVDFIRDYRGKAKLSQEVRSGIVHHLQSQRKQDPMPVRGHLSASPT